MPDTTTKSQILALVGSSIGQNAERMRQEYSEGGSSGTHYLTFQDYYTYSNIIDNIRVLQEYQVNVKLTFVERSEERSEGK